MTLDHRLPTLEESETMIPIDITSLSQWEPSLYNVPHHKAAEAVAICYHALLGGHNDSDSDDSDTDSEFEGENCKVKNWKVNTEVMKDSYIELNYFSAM